MISYLSNAVMSVLDDWNAWLRKDWICSRLHTLPWNIIFGILQVFNRKFSKAKITLDFLSTAEMTLSLNAGPAVNKCNQPANTPQEKESAKFSTASQLLELIELHP